jgi:endonuclease YncB( thermonuclease family)
MGRSSVVVGDTIEIHGQRIRMWDIDAPEGAQTCMIEKNLGVVVSKLPWRARTG